MAEFCLKCFNELNETNYQENEVWMEEDLCEGCAQWKPCVTALRTKLLYGSLGYVARLLLRNWKKTSSKRNSDGGH